jgi:hypothetical protein
VNAGIPGSGISYRDRLDSPHRPGTSVRTDAQQRSSSGLWLVLIVLLIGIVIGAAMF